MIRTLTKKEKKRIARNRTCPDCGGLFLRGPIGGLSENVRCSQCGHEFNITFIDRNHVFAERLDRNCPKLYYKSYVTPTFSAFKRFRLWFFNKKK